MKHVYPVRHPASLDAAVQGATTASRDRKPAPALPHEHDESSHSQARASEKQKDVGKQAYKDATSPSTDTDKGPVMDQVYNEKVVPHRGPVEPRR